ncbi:MAG: phospholipid carrier-dependent glycosyltransferase, partial [Anaerolinea sp.]|nr:phospholipid carrier-dependent glycosyltransferase [Anaerolinea sp.]
VPFHGDEATIIAMSRDYAYQFIDRDLNRILFDAPGVTPWEQDLRLLNGTITKYAIGLSWHLAGFSAADLNEQWDWGGDFAYNAAYNHLPAPDLLRVSRCPPALFTVISAVALFALTWRLGGPAAAYPASALYTLNALLLINGRRAMMEGAWLAFTLLTLIAALAWADALGARRRSGWGWAALTGFSAGLALAAKHTAAFGLAGMIAGMAAIALSGAVQRRIAPLLHLPLIAGLAGLTFYVLNPAWWGDPLGRAALVLRLRADLLAGQSAAFGAFSSPVEALAAFFRYGFSGMPQFYEVAGWEAFIGDPIAAYWASIWRGVDLGPVGGAIVLSLAVSGAIALLRQPRARWIVGGWALAALASTLALTPLDWGRYYLPVVPVSALLAGLGLRALLRRFLRATP